MCARLKACCGTVSLHAPVSEAHEEPMTIVQSLIGVHGQGVACSCEEQAGVCRWVWG